MVGQSKSKTIGIIGLGSIGMRHAKNLIALGHRVLAYDPKVNFSSGNNVSIASIDALLKDGPNGCDAVVIASPTNKHFEHFMSAHEAEKAIFIEKPIFATQEEYDRIIPGVWASGALPTVKMVGYNLRFHSCVKRAKEWINEGFLGQPLWANFTVGQYNDRYTDGVILNWSHEIDLALYLLGPGRVTGSSTRISNGRDDISDILLTHDNGCRSYVHLDYITQPEIRQSLIVGSDATIIFDLVHREAWLRSKSEIMLDHHHDDGSFTSDYVDEMKAFIDRIDGEETIGCTGSEALEVLKICLCVREAAGLKN